MALAISPSLHVKLPCEEGEFICSFGEEEAKAATVGTKNAGDAGDTEDAEDTGNDVDFVVVVDDGKVTAPKKHDDRQAKVY